MSLVTFLAPFRLHGHMLKKKGPPLVGMAGDTILRRPHRQSPHGPDFLGVNAVTTAAFHRAFQNRVPVGLHEIGPRGAVAVRTDRCFVGPEQREHRPFGMHTMTGDAGDVVPAVGGAVKGRHVRLLAMTGHALGSRPSFRPDTEAHIGNMFTAGIHVPAPRAVTALAVVSGVRSARKVILYVVTSQAGFVSHQGGMIIVLLWRRGKKGAENQDEEYAEVHRRTCLRCNRQMKVRGRRIIDPGLHPTCYLA
jgi:hypothetical protein